MTQPTSILINDVEYKITPNSFSYTPALAPHIGEIRFYSSEIPFNLRDSWRFHPGCTLEFTYEGNVIRFVNAMVNPEEPIRGFNDTPDMEPLIWPIGTPYK